jgi:4-hydroxythreonine-4-phosphate dehydrogenase
MSAPVTPGLPVAITMGDPAGIGPELIAAALKHHPDWSHRCVVVGDVGVMRRAVAVAGGSLPLAVVDDPEDVADLPPGCLPLLEVSRLEGLPAWGRVDAAAGRAAGDAIAWAAQAALRGQVAAIVTAPIHKEALAAAGVPYPGHTEWLQAIAARHLGCPVDALPVRMMLSNAELRTVLVSIHVSLRHAIEAVTLPHVLETVRITDRDLRQRLGRPARIAVAGLNPHAGEGGLFGREEIEVIAPAVAQARAEGIDASGPHAPDTVFMRARRGDFDVVVAMYHDQGLIPVKYLGLEHGVNTTLGLPFVRTSPDHGTAFDLAGSGKGDTSSLIAALEAVGLSRSVTMRR